MFIAHIPVRPALLGGTLLLASAGAATLIGFLIASESTPREVTGFVRDEVTGEPIAGARVVREQPPLGATQRTTADADGSYRLEVRGELTEIYVTAPGYCSARRSPQAREQDFALSTEWSSIIGIGASLSDGGSLLGVLPGTPAARAGLRVGDRLTKIDGTDAAALDPRVARAMLRSGKVGSRVAISVERDGVVYSYTLAREIIRFPCQQRLSCWGGTRAEQRIDGVVRDAHGQPIKNASVSLTPVEGEIADVVQTDAGGRFSFKLPAARSELQIYADGYGQAFLPARSGVVTLSGGALQLEGIGAVLRETPQGVFVTETHACGTAAKSGLLRGDRIVAVDDVPVRAGDLDRLTKRIRGAAGTTVRLDVIDAGGVARTLSIERARISLPCRGE
jgi:C-terminal processing protease CtpA/Prc